MKNKLKKNMFTAAFFLSSAEDWRKISLSLEENEFRSINVFALYAFSSELFLKSLLIQTGCDVSKLQGSKGHKLKLLFDTLPEEIKATIKNQTEFEPIKPNTDWETGYKTPGYETFEEALSLISDDFTRLRYSCELFNSFQPFFVCTEFSKNFNSALAIVSNKLVYEKVNYKSSSH